MNASYKIALLAAFAVLAIVVSYYAFLAKPDEVPQESPGSSVVADNADADEKAPASPSPAAPPARRPAPSTPEATPTPAPGPRPGPGSEVTIGPEPGETTPDPLDSEPAEPSPGPSNPLTAAEPDADPADTPRVPYPTGTPGGPGTTEQPGETETPDTTPPVVTPPIITPVPEPAPRPVRPEPSPSAPVTYTVQPGDTLSAIAVKVFGEEAAWVDIAQANPSVDPLRLRPGQVLVMPSREVVEEQGEPAPPAPGQEQRYTIRPGDTLSAIANRFYDDPQAWRVIYNRNRDKIGTSPNRLQAGMEIIIPPRYDGAN